MPATPRPDPRLSQPLWLLALTAASLIALMPPARGYHPLIGWLPLWLLAAPAASLLALHRSTVTAWFRRAKPLVGGAGKADGHHGTGIQAIRHQRPSRRPEVRAVWLPAAGSPAATPAARLWSTIVTDHPRTRDRCHGR